MIICGSVKYAHAVTCPECGEVFLDNQKHPESLVFTNGYPDGLCKNVGKYCVGYEDENFLIESKGWRQ